MLRIISGLLLLIISQISFASVSTSVSVVAATPTYILVSTNGAVSVSDGLTSGDAACSLYASRASYGSGSPFSTGYTYTFLSSSATTNGYNCNVTRFYFSTPATIQTGYYLSVNKSNTIGYSCSTGVLSDASGNPSSSGHFCAISTNVDSCTSYAGQSGYFWVNKVSPPSTICSGTCLASAVTVAGFPDADPLSWQYLQYTYTGETSGCSADSGFTDDATAAAANAAAAERERLAKIQKAIDDAITACGGTGHYTSGTFNGQTIITCKESTAQSTANNSTTTSTTNNPDGSTTTTTTTTTNNSTTTNNNTTTTVNSDGSTTTTGGSSSGGSSSGGSSSGGSSSGGSSSGGSGGGTSGGSTAGTSGTTTTTTTTNPDGSTTSTTSSASSTVLPGTDASYDYQDTDRNDWSSRNFQSVIESNLEKLKGTALYGSITGFFTVSFNGSCSASDFNTSYQGAELSASFDWCARLLPFQVYIKAIVLFLCTFYAFRRAIE